MVISQFSYIRFTHLQETSPSSAKYSAVRVFNLNFGWRLATLTDIFVGSTDPSVRKPDVFVTLRYQCCVSHPT